MELTFRMGIRKHKIKYNAWKIKWRLSGRAHAVAIMAPEINKPLAHTKEATNLMSFNLSFEPVSRD